jgi:hypothetical protein
MELIKPQSTYHIKYTQKDTSKNKLTKPEYDVPHVYYMETFRWKKIFSDKKIKKLIKGNSK